MKKVIVSIAFLALSMCLVIYSCQKENGASEKGSQLSEDSGKAVPLKESTHPKLGWQPEGSKITVTKNGMEAIAPEGWHYIGYDNNGKFFTVSSGKGKSITCTCNTIGTCKPFVATGPWGTTQGCVGNCTDCTMKQSFALEDTEGDIQGGGYYAPFAATYVMKSGDSAPAVFEALFNLEAFKAELSSFIKIAYNGKPVRDAITHEDGSVTAPMGYSLVAVRIMGRGLMLVLPDQYVKATLGYVTAATASCTCSTTGKCTLKYKGVPGLNSTWCEGTCNACTLKMDSKATMQNPGYSVQLHSYTY